MTDDTELFEARLRCKHGLVCTHCFRRQIALHFCFRRNHKPVLSQTMVFFKKRTNKKTTRNLEQPPSSHVTSSNESSHFRKSLANVRFRNGRKSSANIFNLQNAAMNWISKPAINECSQTKLHNLVCILCSPRFRNKQHFFLSLPLSQGTEPPKAAAAAHTPPHCSEEDATLRSNNRANESVKVFA